MVAKRFESLFKKLKKLNPESISEIEKYIDTLSEFDKPNAKANMKALSIQKVLEDIQKSNYKDLHVQKLKIHIRDNWEVIKEHQLLTKFLQKIIVEFEIPSASLTQYHKINRDSSSGYKFEEIFIRLLTWYILSQPKMWNRKGDSQKLKVINNEFLHIPNRKKKKKPDVQLIDTRSGKINYIIELKKSFTKSTLKRYYNQEFSEYSKLGKSIRYLIVIFNASKTKTKTYKQIKDCRIIWNDYNKPEGRNFGVVDSLESIFEEICTKAMNE